MSQIFPRVCQHCEGDVIFTSATVIEPATLRCLQCARHMTAAEAQEMIDRLRGTDQGSEAA